MERDFENPSHALLGLLKTLPNTGEVGATPTGKLEGEQLVSSDVTLHCPNYGDLS